MSEVVKKDRKKIFSRKVSFKKMFAEGQVHKKKFGDEHFSYSRPLQENNGPFLIASVC